MSNLRLGIMVFATLLLSLTGGPAPPMLAVEATSGSPDPFAAAVALLDAGRFDEAEQATTRLIAEVESESGVDSMEAATALHLRIRALNGLGRPMTAEARQLADRVLAILDGKVPPDDPRLKDANDVVWFTTVLEEDERAFRAFQRKGILAPGSQGTDVAKIAERNLAEAERRFGPETVPVAAAAYRVLRARFATAGSDGPDLMPLARSIVSTYEKRIPPEDPRLGAALSKLADVESRAQDFIGAEAHYRRALSIREAALGPDAPEVSWTLHNLGYLMLTLGRKEEARSFLEREEAIDVRRRDRAITPEEKADALGDLTFARTMLGELLCNSDDHAKGRAMLLRTANELEEAFGEAHGRTLDARGTFATCARGVVEEEEGNEVLRDILRLREKVSGSENEYVVQLLTLIGMSEQRLGDLSEARSFYERSMAVSEKVLGPESYAVAVQLNNIGSLHLGSDKGVAELLRAQALVEKLPRPLTLARNIPMNLGVAYLELGEYPEAEAAFERSIVAAEKVGGPTETLSVGTRVYFARLLARKGDFGAAKLHLARALPALEERYGSESRQLAFGLGELAVAHAMAGDGSEATRIAERSTAITEAALTPTHPDLAYALRGLAEVKLAAGDGQGALESALRAAALESRYARLIGSHLAESEALAYVAQGSPALDLALSLAAANPSVESKRAAWDVVVHSRAFVLDEMGLRNRLVAVLDDPEVQVLANRLTVARERLARAAVRSLGGQMSGQDREWLTHELAEKETAERSLAERSRSFREDLRQQSLGLSDVAAVLPPQSALVGYVLYDDGRRTRVDVGGHPGVPSYLAFVMGGRTAAPAVVPLGPAAPIDSLVTALRENIAREATAPGRSPKLSEAAYREVASRLREKIWDPLLPSLAGARRVLVVPDGMLNLVDLAAFPTGANAYLVETGPEISYLSAERDLVPGGDVPPGEGLLVLGAPNFDQPGLATGMRERGGDEVAIGSSSSQPHAAFRGARSACGDFKSLRFEPLPGSGLESRAVASQWREAPTSSRGEDAAAGRRPVTLLEGTSASEALFKKEAPGKQVLHLATHGFFLGDRCHSINPQGASLPAEIDENPLLLSGLGLAGANLRESAGPDVDDGILTAEEIAALDLSGVEWVVLSACDTGLGDLRAGEGVFGLRRAFRLAGAQSIVLSLWPVEDQTTFEWMTALYHERLTHGRTMSDAARRASADLLEKRRAEGAATHPFYWAGFVATGSGT